MLLRADYPRRRRTVTTQRNKLGSLARQGSVSVGDISPLRSGSIPRRRVAVAERTGDFASNENCSRNDGVFEDLSRVELVRREGKCFLPGTRPPRRSDHREDRGLARLGCQPSAWNWPVASQKPDSELHGMMCWSLTGEHLGASGTASNSAIVLHPRNRRMVQTGSRPADQSYRGCPFYRGIIWR
jgi:hypothetical protein